MNTAGAVHAQLLLYETPAYTTTPVFCLSLALPRDRPTRFTPSCTARAHALTLNSNVCRLFSQEGFTESKTTSVVYGPCRPTFSWQYGFVRPRNPSRFRFCRRGDGRRDEERGTRNDASDSTTQACALDNNTPTTYKRHAQAKGDQVPFQSLPVVDLLSC